MACLVVHRELEELERFRALEASDCTKYTIAAASKGLAGRLKHRNSSLHA